MTSNKEQDAASSLEDNDAYTGHASDDDYYDYVGDREASARRTYLVFHGLPEGGMTDRHLIKWVLEAGLGLDPNQYIENEEVERFGRGRDRRPIHVKIQTMEKRREILRRAKNLKSQPQPDFRRICIEPWYSGRQLQIHKELKKKLRELRKRSKGFEDMRIVHWKIVQFVNGKPSRDLCVPEGIAKGNYVGNYVGKYADENFEEEEGESDKQNDSVTS